MANVFENFFNRPKIYKVGQIWHINEIGEDIVITEVSEFYLKMGIIRGMLLSRATHLNDGNDLKFKPTGELKKLYGLERILLRITDGPVLSEDLSYYKGEIPAKIKSGISESLKKRLNLNPVQEEFSAKYIEMLHPLREKTMEKNEQYENKMEKRVIDRVWLNQNEFKYPQNLYKYGIAAGTLERTSIFDEFWNKEKQNREKSVLLMEDSNSIMRLTTVDGILFFTAKSNKFKKISDITLIQKKSEIPAVDNILILGKEERVFTPFPDKMKLLKGDCTIVLKIDRKEFNFNLIIK